VYGFVQASGASQTPQRWLYGGEGTIVLARSPAGVAITPAPIPETLAASLDNPHPAVRIGAVHALGEWLSGSDPARALAAQVKLRQVADNDIPSVADAARSHLASPGLAGREYRLPLEVPAAGPQPGPLPRAASSVPSTLAATLPHGSRWLAVHMVAFSPDGRVLGSASHDAKIRLWDPVTAEQLRILTPEAAAIWSEESSGPIYAVAFSSAGLLASAGADGTVRLWDPATGRHQRTLTGHSNGVRSLAFSPGGRLLASAGDDTTVRLWDPVTGEHLHTLAGHSNWVRSLAFSPDGSVLASAGEDGTVRLWR
jgi:glucose/arabinose dehydrogenase